MSVGRPTFPFYSDQQHHYLISLNSHIYPVIHTFALSHQCPAGEDLTIDNVDVT